MEWKIPMFKIYWDQADITGITNVINRGSYWTTGQETISFENKIAEYIDTKYAITFNSGTSALHALLLAYGFDQGDEIIVPSFTFIATCNSPLFVNAMPVFADIEGSTYGLDPEDVKEKITSKTKAIIPIHYAGNPCLIRELKEIAEDYNLLLIEDAAEAFGATVKNKKVGTFGDSSILSFCQNKIITTGEGGAVVTDSVEIYEKLKLIRSHGRLDNNNNYFSSTNNLDYVRLGYNFRMSSITAAIGISQIEKIKEIIRLRKEKAEYMTKRLSEIEGIVTPVQNPDGDNVYQMYPILVSEDVRDKLILYLSANGIFTKVNFYPAHLTSFYRNRFLYKYGDLPITEKISSQNICLPMYPTLEKEQIDYIVTNIGKFMELNDG